MLFDEKELANKANFKEVVADYLTAYYTDKELPDDKLAIRIGEFSAPIREKILAAIDNLSENIFPINEMETDMPMLWIETSDAFDMAGEGDFSGIEMVLNDFLYWLTMKRK